MIYYNTQVTKTLSFLKFCLSLFLCNSKNFTHVIILHVIPEIQRDLYPACFAQIKKKVKRPETTIS